MPPLRKSLSCIFFYNLAGFCGFARVSKFSHPEPNITLPVAIPGFRIDYNRDQQITTPGPPEWEISDPSTKKFRSPGA